MKTEIALATYNGSLYLSELLDSILKQTKLINRIIVRDDCSTDNTVEILLSYQKKGLPIEIISDNKNNMGILENFSIILSNTSADYVFLCDQDDIWLPNKAERMINRISWFEKIYGKHIPFLVFSDMKIVDKNLQIISNSGMKYQGFYPKTFKTFKQSLIQNIVPGCAMIVNQNLLKLALPIPKEAIVHDWWLVLVATAFGKINYIDEPLFCYRQHASNNLGASAWNIFSIGNKLKNFKQEPELIYNGFKKALMQAEVFYERYKSILPKKNRLDLERLLKIKNQKHLQKTIETLKFGANKQGLLRTLAFYFSLCVKGFN